MFDPPDEQFLDDRSQRFTGWSEPVPNLAPSCFFIPVDHARCFKLAQAHRQQLRRDAAEGAGKIAEALRSIAQIAHDQQRPLFANDFQCLEPRRSNVRRLLFWPWRPP